MKSVYIKELYSYFLTPGGYIFMGAFLLISGLLFTLQNLFSGSSDFASVLGSLIFIFLLVVPILTMRLFTDEKRQRTDILLLSSPVTITGIVLGKYFAAATLFVITLVITMLYPLLLSFHGRIDWPQIMGTYVGFFFLGNAFIAVGTFISEIAESQSSAAVITFSALLASWVSDFITGFVPSSSEAGAIFVLAVAGLLLLLFRRRTDSWKAAAGAGAAVLVLVAVLYFSAGDLFYGLISRSISWFSLTSRFQRFPMGILRVDAIIYYLSFSAFFLYLTGSRIESRRWS
jgi:ABC-2 type transport system permease protein